MGDREEDRSPAGGGAEASKERDVHLGESPLKSNSTRPERPSDNRGTLRLAHAAPSSGRDSIQPVLVRNRCILCY